MRTDIMKMDYDMKIYGTVAIEAKAELEFTKTRSEFFKRKFVILLIH